MTPTSEKELLAFFEMALPGFLEYLRSHATAIEQVELAVVKDGIVSFPATQILGGVQKTVRVPLSVITANIDDAEKLCRDIAEYAEEQGDFAMAQALLAMQHGDYAKEQGDFANQQGVAIMGLKEEITGWYQPFKSSAEGWLSTTRAAWDSWFSSTVSAWTDWYDSKVSAWNSWFSSTVSAWNNWFSSTSASWTDWYESVKAAWTEWFASASTWLRATKDDWNAWFATAKRYVSEWSEKEAERQSAEEMRLEMMKHPPIPSERGYWMFWDIAIHEYVESGYSSRGTTDWPMFFWDYDTMGIGVVTTRDYSRFFIDEQGRFGMLM